MCTPYKNWFIQFYAIFYGEQVKFVLFYFKYNFQQLEMIIDYLTKFNAVTIKIMYYFLCYEEWWKKHSIVTMICTFCAIQLRAQMILNVLMPVLNLSEEPYRKEVTLLSAEGIKKIYLINLQTKSQNCQGICWTSWKFNNWNDDIII